MTNFGERHRADLAELVETERLQKRAVVVFQQHAKQIAAQLESLLDNTTNEGEEEPVLWEAEFARLVSERQHILFLQLHLYFIIKMMLS